MNFSQFCRNVDSDRMVSSRQTVVLNTSCQRLYLKFVYNLVVCFVCYICNSGFIHFKWIFINFCAEKGEIIILLCLMTYIYAMYVRLYAQGLLSLLSYESESWLCCSKKIGFQCWILYGFVVDFRIFMINVMVKLSVYIESLVWSRGGEREREVQIYFFRYCSSGKKSK